MSLKKLLEIVFFSSGVMQKSAVIQSLLIEEQRNNTTKGQVQSKMRHFFLHHTVTLRNALPSMILLLIWSLKTFNKFIEKKEINLSQAIKHNGITFKLGGP